MEGKKIREVAFPLEKNIRSIFQTSHKKNLFFHPSCKQTYISPNPQGTPGSWLAVPFALVMMSAAADRSDGQPRNKLAAPGGRSHIAQLQLQTSGFTPTHLMKIGSPHLLKSAPLESRST